MHTFKSVAKFCEVDADFKFRYWTKRLKHCLAVTDKCNKRLVANRKRRCDVHAETFRQNATDDQEHVTERQASQCGGKWIYWTDYTACHLLLRFL